jgi:hypothetical protein
MKSKKVLIDGAVESLKHMRGDKNKRLVLQMLVDDVERTVRSSINAKLMAITNEELIA